MNRYILFLIGHHIPLVLFSHDMQNSSKFHCFYMLKALPSFSWTTGKSFQQCSWILTPEYTTIQEPMQPCLSAFLLERSGLSVSLRTKAQTRPQEIWIVLPFWFYLLIYFLSLTLVWPHCFAVVVCFFALIIFLAQDVCPKCSSCLDFSSPRYLQVFLLHLI